MNTKSVGLVTHEAEFAHHLGQLLEAAGYPVSIALEGAQVPAMVAEEDPQLLVVNLYLRNPSGLEILQQLRTQGYEGKIIVLAGMSAGSDVSRALMLGADQVLRQPVSYHHIMTAVRAAIGLPVSREVH